MRYPTLTAKDSVAFAREVTAEPASANHVAAATFCAQWAGQVSIPGSTTQREVDLTALETVAQALAAVVSDPANVEATSKTTEGVEGDFSGPIHAALKDVPTPVLDDPRFWRYLAVRYFAEFILWRESGAFAKGNIATYFEASNGVESIPLRLYLRGQAAYAAEGKYDLAAAIDEGTDFWRSHILRVRTGRAPRLVGEYVRMQQTNRMLTATLRTFARLVNRMWANVTPTEYDARSAKRLLDDLRSRL